MRRIVCIVLAAVVYIFSAAQATAKVYWLPDFLKDNTDRMNSHYKEDGTPDTKEDLTCPSGCMTSAEKGSMVCAYTIPVAGIGNCYCGCEDEDTCAGLQEIADCGEPGCKTESATCPGKCEECRQTCDTSAYPYTSATEGCRADMLGGATCTDDEGTHYEECYCQGEVEAVCGLAQTCEEYCGSDAPVPMCTKCSDPLDCDEGFHWNKDIGCVADECPSGYATSTSNCGTSTANTSWVLGTVANGKSGDDWCYQCISKCNSGYYDKDSFVCTLEGDTTPQLCTWSLNQKLLWKDNIGGVECVNDMSNNLYTKRLL